MPGDTIKNRIPIIISHIQDWLDKADLGDRRVILTTPLQYPDHAVLDKCRALGLVYEDGGRYLLEKAFNRKDTLLSQLGNPHNSKN